MADADRLAIRYCEEGSFGVTPAGDVTGSATISADTTDDSYNDSGSGFLTDGFVPNQTVLVSGFVDPLNNGYKTIVSVTAAKMIVKENLVTEVAPGSSSIRTAFNELRFTSEGLGQDTDTQESAEIRDDRQVADVKRTSVSAGGDLPIEMSFGAFDPLLIAVVLASDWSTEVSDTQITFSMADGDNSINDSGSGFVAAGFLQYQWVKIEGFAIAANNGYAKLASVAAGKMVLEGLDVEDEAATPSVTITMLEQITNGVQEHFYSVEKEYSDIAKFDMLRGQELNAFNLDTNAENIITGSFGWMGKDSESPSPVSSASLGTPQAAPDNLVFSAVDDVEAIIEGGVATDVVQVTMALVNNLRAKPEVGVLGASDIGTGKIGITGTLQAYLDDMALLDKYKAFTTTSLAQVFEDGDGNAYIIDFPYMKFTDGKAVAGGQNTDIIADMTYTAYRDPDEDVTIRIARYTAP